MGAILSYRSYKLAKLVNCEVLADHQAELLVRLEIIATLVGHVGLHLDWLEVEKSLFGCNYFSISLLDSVFDVVREERNFGGATKT